MTQSYPPGPRSISLLDTGDFPERTDPHRRVDKVLDDGVTLSAVPDDAGGTRWEARAADGRSLRVSLLTIEPAMAAVPIVVDATEGIYVCYEDEALQQTWCVKVGSH